MNDLNAILRGELPPSGRVLCPFHDDRHASALMYPDGGFHCFTCSAHAKDLIDLVRKIAYPDEPYGMGRTLAMAQLSRNGNMVATRPPEPIVPLWASEEQQLVMNLFMSFARMETHPDFYRRMGEERALQNPSRWVAVANEKALARTKRALQAEPFLEQALLDTGLVWEDGSFRLKGRMMIADLQGERVVYYQARTMGLHRAKYLNPPALTKPLYGKESLHRDTPFVLVCEGPFDVLPLIEAGHSAVALLGNVPNEADVLEFGDRPVVVALDNDEVGLEKGALMTQGLQAAGVNAIQLQPQAGKDCGDWIRIDGVSEVIKVIQWELPARYQ